MARPIAPCGTESAHRRHRRLGEDVDEACAEGHALFLAKLRGDAVDLDELVKRAHNVTALRIVPPAAPRTETMSIIDHSRPSAPTGEVPDHLTDLLENLDLLRSAMEMALPREVASLSRQRQALIREIAEMTEKGEKSLKEQLAEARAAREASRA